MRIKKYITALGFHSTRLDKKINCRKDGSMVFVSYKNLAESKIRFLENENEILRGLNAKLDTQVKDSIKVAKEFKKIVNSEKEQITWYDERIKHFENLTDQLCKDLDKARNRGYLFLMLFFFALFICFCLL